MKGTSGPSKWGMVIFLAAMAVGIVGIAFVVVWLLSFLDGPFNDREFDREIWLANAYSGNRDNPRGGMLEDLLHRHLKQGMKKEEVGLAGSAGYREIYRKHLGVSSWHVVRHENGCGFPRLRIWR